MDDRIVKNTHRELRTMNGKIDELELTLNVLTSTIRSQSSLLYSSMKMKSAAGAYALQPILNTTQLELALDRVQVAMVHQGAAMRQLFALKSGAAIAQGAAATKATDDKTKLLPWAENFQKSDFGKTIISSNEVLKPFKDLGDTVVALFEGPLKIKTSIDEYRKWFQGKGGESGNNNSDSNGSCTCSCCAPASDRTGGNGGGSPDNQSDSRRRSSRRARGRQGRQDSEPTQESRRRSDNGGRSRHNRRNTGANQRNSRRRSSLGGSSAPPPEPSTGTGRQELGRAAQGENGSASRTRTDRHGPAWRLSHMLPKSRKGRAALGIAGAAGAIGAGYALFSGSSKEGQQPDDGSSQPSTTITNVATVAQSSIDMVQAVQSMRGAADVTAGAAQQAAAPTTANAIRASAQSASAATRTASAAKKVGWFGKLLKGAKAVSKATKLLRLTPAGFLGGLALDAGLWAAEKFLLPKDEDQGKDELQKPTLPTTLPATLPNNIRRPGATLPMADASRAPVTLQAGIGPQVSTTAGTSYRPYSDMTGTGIPVSTSPTLNVPPAIPGRTGTMDVNANSNVVMNLNVNGYVDMRMIDEIKRIAREQFDASFRSFERSIASKMPKPQTGPGGVTSH
ncbi:hypothetical protein [Paenibacillus sp. UMB4589-SE434]|uniref:hypothetical protein n=1 Tax=Paenibacillus sp. UMB4589-SE434 TaxID=3046314 RepID=UPI00254DFE70|nr:hypothetical protein [Paenibacillus sp. UMB4589-SE434]MDK8181959.1 hypothetical protein [Paenibacillus sp. UMB4589-SE434]